MSVALISPDETRRRILETALSPFAEVREFRSYPTATDEFEWLIEQSYQVVIMDLDSDEDATLDLAQRIKDAGDAIVMVFSERADQRLAVRAMRAGAREFLLLPFEDGVVAEALARNPIVSRTSIVPAKAALGNLFIFLGAKGGCGVTAATCNFAVALTRSSEQKTLLIDLNFPIGDAALTLGLAEEFSTEDALRTGDRLDRFLLKKLLVQHNSGLMVLSAPSKLSELEPSAEGIQKLIATARSTFDHVVVDLGSRIDVGNRDILKNASTVYLVTQTGIADLRNANRLVSRYFVGSVPKVEVVLNRFQTRLLEGMNEEAVSMAVGKPVCWKIPEDQEAAREMQKGETGNAETRLGRVCLEMASAITGRPLPPRRKKAFGLIGFAGNFDEDISSNTISPNLSIAPQLNWVYTRTTARIKWSAPAPIRYGEPLTATQLNASASVPGTFEYNPGLGEVLTAGTHTLSVVFMPADTDRYDIAQATVPLEVLLATSAIQWPTPAPIRYGTPLSAEQLCATASVPGSFEYSPALGELLPAGTHKLSVTFTPADAESHATAEASVLLEVAMIKPVIDWPAPAPVREGTPLSEVQLCATASVPGQFDYSLPQGATLPPGTHNISVVFVPADGGNYDYASATVPFTVLTKETPQITWAVPHPITYGTPLSSLQLCATASAPGKLEYSVAEGQLLPAGTHRLSVTFTPTDPESNTPAEASLLLEVAKAEPVIEWSTPQPIREGTPLSAIQLCASASVPGRFDYSLPEGASLPPGTHTLSALFVPTDSANYASATATVHLTVSAKEIPQITWNSPAPITYGAPLSGLQLCATASVAGTLEYSPRLGEVLSAGRHTLTANFTPADGTNYASTQLSVHIEVAKASPVIHWPTPQPVKDGTRLSATQLCASASAPGTFDYSPGIGKLLEPGDHTLAVTFTPSDCDNYTSAQATVSIAVAPRKTPEISWQNPEPITYGTALSSAQLCANAPVAGIFDYSPAPGETLTAGRHTLSATFTPTDSENYANAHATVSLEVKKMPPSIEWPSPAPITYGKVLDSAQLCAKATVPGSFQYSPAAGELLGAGTHSLFATFTPTDTGNFAATEATVSIDVAKATPIVNWPELGTIECGTALGDAQLRASASVPGTFTYTPPPGEMLAAGSHKLSVVFTPEDSANYEVVQGTQTLEVVKATPTISWPAPEPLTYGTVLSSTQLCATASVPGTLNYSFQQGELLFAGRHTLSVTFSPTDGERYRTVEAVVSLDVLQANPVIEWTAPETIQCGTPLTATQLCATANIPGTFSYSPEIGSLLPAGTHELSAVFTPADAVNFAGAEAAVSLEVVKITPSLVWANPNPITYGTKLTEEQLCATASVTGRFDYFPAPGAILATGTHTVSVKFTPADMASYNTTEATVSVEVLKATPVIDWPVPEPITCDAFLTSKQLCATTSVPGTFKYEPEKGKVLPAGKHTLSVTFTPTDTANYAAAQASVSLDVERITPIIDWASPRPITCGTALSTNQLNAATWVPGMFSYSPAAGALLPVGTHTLSVSFIPTDSVSYATVQTTVSLEVLEKPKPTVSWSAPTPIPYGTPLGAEQLRATASIAGTFTYSPAAGEVLPVGSHELSVTFTPFNISEYDEVRATVTLSIKKAKPKVAWVSPEPITYGTSLGNRQLSATASIPGTFEYSPAPGAVLRVGNHELSATFTPTDSAHYSTARATAMITVTKAKPVVEWSHPKPLRTGMPLTYQQLCATASVPGTFFYSRSAGEELSEGFHTLTASFIPSDAELYEAADTSVEVEVRRQVGWGGLIVAVGACLILLLLALFGFTIYTAVKRSTTINIPPPAILVQSQSMADAPKLTHRAPRTLHFHASAAIPEKAGN